MNQPNHLLQVLTRLLEALEISVLSSYDEEAMTDDLVADEYHDRGLVECGRDQTGEGYTHLTRAGAKFIRETLEVARTDAQIARRAALEGEADQESSGVGEAVRAKLREGLDFYKHWLEDAAHEEEAELQRAIRHDLEGNATYADMANNGRLMALGKQVALEHPIGWLELHVLPLTASPPVSEGEAGRDRAALEALAEDFNERAVDADRRYHERTVDFEKQRARGEHRGFALAREHVRKLLAATPSAPPVEAGGPKFPPAERLAESLRWAIDFIDDPKRRRLPQFKPDEAPGGEQEHDWTEWASAHDWLKDVAAAASPAPPVDREEGQGMCSECGPTLHDQHKQGCPFQPQHSEGKGSR